MNRNIKSTVATIVTVTVAITVITSQAYAFKVAERENFTLDTKLRGQFQGFYQSIKKEEEKAGFAVRRARLYFEGHAFYPWLKYKSQITLEGGKASLRDLFVDATKYKLFEIKLGQYKVGFTREYLTSSSKLALVDRSLNHSYFNLGRDIGLTFHGESSLIQYGVGVFSGAGKFIHKPKDVYDKYPMISGRFEISPFGILKPNQTVFEKDKFKLALGFAGAYSKFSFDELYNRADKSKLMKTALEGWENSPEKVVELSQVTSDLSLFYGSPESRFHLEGDFNWGKIHPFVEASGYRVQVGLLINKFGIAARFASVSMKEPSKETINEITAGPSYYFSKHNLKVQADYSFKKYKESGKEENLVRLQLQVYIK